MTIQRHPEAASKLEDLLIEGAAAVIATDLEGVITHWSVGAQRLYGWSGEEAIGLPLVDLLVSACDREQAVENMETIRLTGGWEGEFDVRRKDGSSMPTFTQSTLIKDDVGRPVGLLGLSMDLSDSPA
jgi:PAS domain S-box-containing protein